MKRYAKILTIPCCFNITGIDPIFNFGDFNVTPISSHYLLICFWSIIEKVIHQYTVKNGLLY